jgi:hypothetical protein
LQVQLEPDGPPGGALPDAPAAREGLDQPEPAAVFGVDVVDAAPKPSGPAVVGDLDPKPTIDDGIGDLERAIADPGWRLVERAGDGLADQQASRFSNLGVPGQGLGDELAGGGDLCRLS